MNHKHRAGQLGGIATVQRHGREHMRAIGKRGAAAFYRKYRLEPQGQSVFAIIDRVTGQVKAFNPSRD